MTCAIVRDFYAYDRWGLRAPYGHARLFRGRIYDAWLQKSASEEDLGLRSAEIANIRRKISPEGTACCSKPASPEGPCQDSRFERRPSQAAEQAVATPGAADRTNVPG